MRAYLTAYAAKMHERHFGWKAFRVLTVTTDHHRMRSMMDALHRLHVAGGQGAPLFYFATRDEIGMNDCEGNIASVAVPLEPLVKDIAFTRIAAGDRAPR